MASLQFLVEAKCATDGWMIGEGWISGVLDENLLNIDSTPQCGLGKLCALLSVKSQTGGEAHQSSESLTLYN